MKRQKSGDVTSSERIVPWLESDALTALLEKLGKKSKRSPADLVEAAVGSDDVGGFGQSCAKRDATIAILVERGMFPKRLVHDVRWNCYAGRAWMKPEALLSVVKLGEWGPWAEYVLAGIGIADPTLIAPERDAELPPSVARMAPLARRILGLSSEPLADDVAAELARRFVTGRGTFNQLVRSGEILELRYISTYAAAREEIAVFGLSDRWDDLVAAAAAPNDFGAIWRVEPVILRAPLEELAGLLLRDTDVDGELLFRWLATRADPPDALARAAQSIEVGDPTYDHRGAYRIREALTVVAGARLATAGAPIPEALDAYVWFLDGVLSTAQSPAYRAALSAWPRDRVLARVRWMMTQDRAYPSLAVPERAAVGLSAHPDAALTAKLLDDLPWGSLRADDGTIDGPAFLGRLPIEALPDLLSRLERAPRKEGSKEHEQPERAALRMAIQNLVVTAAERSGRPFNPELDLHFHPTLSRDQTAWRRAVRLIPQERADAYFLTWAKLDPYEFFPDLGVVSDSALDEIIGLMFHSRNAQQVNVTYPKGVSFGNVSRGVASCGARALPMIQKHLLASGKPDAKAIELLNHLPVPPSARARLLAEVGGGA